MNTPQPRFVRVTHADAEAAQQAALDAERRQQADAERTREVRARDRAFATADSMASTKRQWQAGIRVDDRGSVRQAFSCNCGKHSHGHGQPDHPDAFAAIIKPTRFEALPPEWAKDFNARADAELLKRGAALAERVRATRTRLGKTDRSRR